MREILSLDPAKVRQWLESGKFLYPRYSEAEPLAGFATVPVFPLLWEWFVQSGGHISPDSMVQLLMGRADPEALRTAGSKRIESRARKLVLDFGRELHAYAMLSRAFPVVRWRASRDLGMGVDFEVSCLGWTVGIQAQMKAQWRPENWASIKEERRSRRGEMPIRSAVVSMDNRTREPERLRNGLWIFRAAHVEEVKEKIRDLGLALPAHLEI